MRNGILNTSVFVIMVLISIGVYLNSLHNGYHYDDIHHIVGNQYLTSLRNTPLFFTDSRTFSSLPEARNHYRPLLLTSYALNYYFSKFKPAGYHVVNLSFHVGSAFFLFLIVQAMVGSRCHSEACKSKPKNLTSWFIRFFASLRMTDRGQKLEVRSQKLDGGGFFAAVAAGLIFLTTPFNSEVVNYISARSSVMCTFFYLLAFYCWVEFRSRKPEPTVYYIASLLAFLLAMLTKEIAITLPVMLFVYDVYFLDRHCEVARGNRSNLTPPQRSEIASHLSGARNDEWTGSKSLVMTGPDRRSFLTPNMFFAYLPFVLTGGFTGFILRKVFCGNVLPFGATSSRGLGTQFFTEMRLILKYLYMTLIPVGLSVEHPVGLSSSLWEPKVLVSLIILMLIAVTLLLLWRSGDTLYRSISFFGIWFFITMSPTAVIPLNAMLQENRGYLPGAGVIAIAGILLSQTVFTQKRHCEEAEGRRSNLKPGGGLLRTLRVLAMTRVAGVLALAALVITYGGATRDRNRVWKDDLTLWRDVEEKYPMSKSARMELGRVHMAQDPDMGEEELKEILLNEPRNTSAMNNLGNLYANRGRHDLAEEMYLKAIEINPTDYKLHFNLAKVYKDLGNKEAAAERYREVLRLAPDYTKAAELLAGLYVEMGKEEMIEGAFQTASGKDPGNPAFHRGLGVAYARQQKWDMAIGAFKKVLEITPDDVQTRVDLGDSYMKTGRLDLAEREFHTALELDPGNRMANQGLGIIYQQQGRYEPALKHYEKAIEGRSPSPRVLNNMGSIYLATGRTGKAIDAFREALRIDPSYHIARINLGRAYEGQKAGGSR